MSPTPPSDVRAGLPPAVPAAPMDVPERPPSGVRHLILGLAVAVAVLLYLDRYCLSTADRDIKATLGLSEGEMSVLLGAFFWTYALGQLPLGFLADRYGARRMLSGYMFVWSIFTGLIGAVTGFADLI